MTDQFNPCLAFTLAPENEGGYSNDSRDPGKATNRGITEATLSHWRGAACTPADVQALTVDEASAIYRALYWNTLRCWGLLPGIDLMVFDFGVNAGPQRSALRLQAAVDAKPDGIIGPLTAIAARGAGAKFVIPALYTAQVAYYRSCDDFPIFGNGWLARTARRRDQALSMAALPATPQGATS